MSQKEFDKPAADAAWLHSLSRMPAYMQRLFIQIRKEVEKEVSNVELLHIQSHQN
jgi:hypothetical protein